MKNLRHQNKGQAPLLPPELQEAFYQALRKPHPRDGLWNTRNAAEWLSQRLGRPVDPRRAWSWMRRLGFAPLRPRPRHRQADPEAQEAFKKTLPDGFLVEAALPLEVWAFAAHRLGLKPIRRRVWAPLAQERPRYRWLWVYAFVTGESECWLLPSVSTEAFHLVLSSFARLRRAGEGRLVLDGLAHLQAGAGAGGRGPLFSSALLA